MSTVQGRQAHPPTDPGSPAKGPDARRFHFRQLLAASVGHTLEWFDWYVYAMLVVYFSPQFFPETDNTLVPLLGAMAIFAVGFFARPMGGLVIGMLADRFGRKATLSATIIGMGVGSLMIGLAPTYAQVGVLAPAILVIARLLQGASAGGEYAAGSAFLIESAPQGRRGFFSSFFYIAATVANLTAIVVAAVLANTLSTEDMESWGWRLPFIAGALATIGGYLIRRHASETLEEAPAGETRKKVGMFDFFREHPKQALQVFGLTAAPALVFYIWSSFLPTYASITVDLDVKIGLVTGSISLAVFLVLQPLFGLLSDKVGRKPLLIVFGLFFVFGTVPLLNSLTGSFTSLLIVQMTGLVFIALWSSISSAIASELFPARLRGSGIGFPYALAVALFGGTGPYIATWLVDINRIELFGWYVTVVAVISTVVFLRLPETAHKPLQ
ncbi:MFS transporter (plasmid) [Gordonia rubripertincta]|nr:transporter [Dietzia sp. 111N12-1]QMU23457.1 MFS transporter [Gordonia rubripertincta]QXU56554.1 MFS transporter [Rhodococcus sp. LW-XY12]